jgi:hypothetical protein
MLYVFVTHVASFRVPYRNLQHLYVLPRSEVSASHVSVIPNAVDSVAFRPPEVKEKPKDTVTVLLGCRLVYR